MGADPWEGARMRRALIPIVILALTGAQGPAAAEDPAERPELPPLRVPANAVSASSSGGTLDVDGSALRIEDLILEHIDPSDVRTHPDAVRAFIEATSGISLPDLRPEHSSDGDPSFSPAQSRAFDEPPSPIPGEEPTGNVSYPSPGGDLTGDGLADVLVFDVSLPSEKIHVRALAGTDGHQIWQRPLDASDVVGMPVGDLTGDGIDDLLMWTFEVLEETEVDDCPSQSSCRYQYDASYDWIVGLRSGADGKRIWATRYAGEDHYLYDHQVEGTPPVTFTERNEESYLSSNYSVFPYVSGDHDGDGLADLVLESIDIDFLLENTDEVTAGVVHQDTGQIRLHGAARAQVTRGNSGAPLLTRSSEMGPGVALLQPVNDLVGGPAPDLLWEESVLSDNSYSCIRVEAIESCPDEPDRGYAIELDLLDGDTLEPAWQAGVDDIVDGFALALPDDVTGDGVDDVMVMALVEQELPFTLRLLSGADGTELWTREQRPGSHYWEFPVIVEDLTGDATADLVLASFMTLGEPMESGFAAGLARVDGRTGTTISETIRPFAGIGDHDFTSTFLYIGRTDDVDGDAGADVLAGSVASGYDEDPDAGGSVLGEARSSVVIESGPSGDVIHEKSEAELFTVDAPADLSGDGLADAFEWHYPITEDGDFGVVVHRLAPATTLWSRTLTEDEFWNIWTGGDHDGSPGEEVLYGRNDLMANHWKSAVASLRGSNGSERWRSEK